MANRWGTERLSDTALTELTRILGEFHGLDVSRYEPSFLSRSLEKRLQLEAGTTHRGYLERLARDRDEANLFQHSLGIHHSEFFREPLLFALLEERILPEIFAKIGVSPRKELRIWSAGCAAGHEAYSLAISVQSFSETCAQPLPFRIFATDCSEEQIAAARVGSFSPVCMKNVRLGQLQRWFLPMGEAYAVSPQLRERIDFSVYNLFDERSGCPPESLYGGFDIVVCSNLLYYYRPEAQRQILQRVQRCLVPDGYLITGTIEHKLVNDVGLFTASMAPLALFQKTQGGA